MRLFATSMIVLGLLAAPGLVFALAKDKKDEAAQKPKPKFTVGKATTYVDGPLDSDGLIDYPAALNARLAKGATPANNANVLIWKALGPRPEGARMPPAFFRWLGIPEPPEQGEYFIDMFRYLKDQHNLGQDKVFTLMDRTSQRPWTAKEFPEVAAWLKANEKPLALAVEASKRTHYYSPLVSKGSGKHRGDLISVLLPGVQKCRALANALVIRAMLRLGEGKPEAAWRDLRACHRLGRLVGRGATLIEGLVGVALDAIAAKADQTLLADPKVSAKQLRQCLADLEKLPPMPPMADKVNLGERFMFLDCVMMLCRGGIQHLEGLAGGAIPRKLDPKARRILEAIDWDPALRNGNRLYDRMAAAMRARDRQTREKMLNDIEAELNEQKKNIIASGTLAKALAGKETPKVLGKAIGDVLIGLLVPAARKVQTAGDRTEQTQRNLAVAFALAVYQREHGRYPKTLDALVPKYLPKVPGDLFSGKALVYRPTGTGYLLYSFGPNGKDDQGRGLEDKPQGDDLAVRVPLPPLPQK